MRRLCTTSIFFLLTRSYSEHLGGASATVPPQSNSFWGKMNNDYRRDADDVPIVGDRFHFSKRGRRKRRRRSKASSDDTDSEDESPIPFFYDQEYDIDWREQYELDKMRRRHRSNNRRDKEAEYGITSPWNTVRQWTYTKTGIHMPRINLHFDPITILKIRKSWHNIVPGAIVRVGADFETQHRLGGGIWRLRGCLEDKLLGGRFTMKSKGDKGVIMEYTKSWLFAGTGSLATRFNLCAQYDIHSNRGSARFGFRTENMNSVGTIVSSPTMFGGSRRQGFTIIPTIPLDGPDGHFKLEAKTRFELPEPEITVGMDLSGVSVDGGSVGMGIGGDIDVEIDELNVVCLF